MSATAGARTSRRAPRPIRTAARGIHRAVTGVRDTARAAVAGDRPLVVALMVTLVLSVILLSGPMQSYLAGRERVAVLDRQQEALAQDLARLRQEQSDLNDPTQLELKAREYGFIRPGEVPWYVVPPDTDRPQIVPPPADADAPADPWWVRMWNSVTGVFGS